MNANPKAGLTALILAAGFLGTLSPAWAEIPVVNREFLNSHVPAVRALAEEPVDGAQDAAMLLKRILITRAQAQQDLFQVEPEGSLDGIITMDTYDDEAVLALYAVTENYVQQDPVLPPDDYLIRFQQLTSGAPDLGNAPVGFMVLGMTGMLLNAADSLKQDPDLDPGIVDKTAVQMSHLGTDLFHKAYSDAQEDPTLARSSGQFYRSSVILRLRCPKDNGTYELTNMKNRVDDNGDIYSLSYVACSVCGDSRVIEFRQELASRLNRMNERQDLDAIKKRQKSRKSVDP